MDKKIVINVYDAERYDKNGSGLRRITETISDNTSQGDLDTLISEVKNDQKLKNTQYRLSLVKKPPPVDLNITKIIEENRPNNEFKLEYQDDITLDLDPDTGNTTVLFGSSKQGKTTTMLEILKKQYIPNPNNIVTLFCRNDHGEIYQDIELKCNTFNNKARDYVLLQKFINSKCKNKYNFTNAIDDIINVRYSKILNEMILTLRNSNISTLICLQYVRLLSKQARGNVNNVLCFQSNTDENTEEIIKVYLRNHFKKMGIKKLPDMVILYKEITKNHGFIYVNMRNGNISYHRLNLNNSSPITSIEINL